MKESSMSNIIEFPVTRKLDTLTNEITQLQDALTTRFEKLTELYVDSRVVEQECGDLQERYDNLIMQYAGAIGSENVPAGVLEYCTGVIAVCDPDTDDISLELEEKPAVDKNVEDVIEFMDSITNFLRGKLDELQ